MAVATSDAAESPAVVALKETFDFLCRGGHSILREIGSEAVGLFFEAWHDAPEDHLVQKIAGELARASLEVLERSLLERPKLSGSEFFEALRLMRFGAELNPGKDPVLLPHVREALIASSVERLLSTPPSALATLEFDCDSKGLLVALREYSALEEAAEFFPELAAESAAAPFCGLGLASVFEGLKDFHLELPGSKVGANLDESLGYDLEVATQILRIASARHGAKGSAHEMGWVLEYSLYASALLLETRRQQSLANIVLGVDALADFSGNAEADALLHRVQAWVLEHPPRLSGGPPGGIRGSVHRQFAVAQATVRALRPRGKASRPRCEALAHRATSLLQSTGLARGSFALRAPARPCYMGVPDKEVGDQVPMVQPSARGGPGGRGLFTLSAGRPIPLEFLPDKSAGVDGILSEEENEQYWDSKRPGYEYIVWLTLDVWFRDEFSQSELDGQRAMGKLRPLAAALPGWIESGCCAQDVQWDPEDCKWTIKDEKEACLLAAHDSSNLAAMANDALFGTCGSDFEYERKDPGANNLVMVPCARPAREDPSKVAFRSIWVYPRRGWNWDKPQELTLGYGFEITESDSGCVNLVDLCKRM